MATTIEPSWPLTQMFKNQRQIWQRKWKFTQWQFSSTWCQLRNSGNPIKCDHPISSSLSGRGTKQRSVGRGMPPPSHLFLTANIFFNLHTKKNGLKKSCSIPLFEINKINNWNNRIKSNGTCIKLKFWIQRTAPPPFSFPILRILNFEHSRIWSVFVNCRF